MVVFSIIVYVALAGWFLMGSEKNQRISMIIGTCVSSFLAFWFLDVNNLAMVIYLILGIVCIFFYWISVDSKSAQKNEAKNKYIAAVLALLLGGVGIHRFYLKKTTSGLFYVLFCWSLIPGIIAIVEAIRFFAINQTKFDGLYNKGIPATSANTPKEEVREEQPPHEKDYGWHTFEEETPVYEPEPEPYQGTNEREADNLNYRDLRLYGYNATAIGTVEDFSIVVRAKGKSYTFKAKNGDICSYRSSSMRASKNYEVT